MGDDIEVWGQTLREVGPTPTYGDFASALTALEQLAEALDSIVLGESLWNGQPMTLLAPHRRQLDTIRRQVEHFSDVAARQESLRTRTWVIAPDDAEPTSSVDP